MSDLNDLELFLELGWERLSLGLREHDAAARQPVMATVSPAGRPEARTLVLRAVDRENVTIEVHTDRGSGKIQALAANPHAQFLIWDAPVQLQIRLSTRVDIRHGDPVAHKWARVPANSRMAYGAIPKPGTPIDHADGYKKVSNSGMFVVLVCAIESIELMQLCEPHRRALFRSDSDWTGQWIVP